MKNLILSLSAAIILLNLQGCVSGTSIEPKPIEVKFLAIYPLSSAELSSDYVSQIYKPITVDSKTVLNAFHSYTIRIVRLGTPTEKHITIKGDQSWYDLQLFGSPKVDKLREIAENTFKSLSDNSSLIKPVIKTQCELLKLQSDFITKSVKAGYKILVFDPKAKAGELLMKKHPVYSSYNTLKVALGKAYSKTSNRFLVVHKIARCEPIIDYDRDGLTGAADHCPYNWGPKNLNGCPDKDGDGIIDKWDRCPTQKGTLKDQGCPDRNRDTDKDGVADYLDHCPRIAGLNSNHGCPERMRPLGDISYNRSVLYFDKDPKDKIKITITKMHGSGTPIVINDYLGQNINMSKYNLIALTPYNIGVVNEKGQRVSRCIVWTQSGEFCDCRKQ
jgi:hypothetical protein